MKQKSEKPYIIAIGASAGGLQAIQELFQNIPEDTGLSFVIVQHLSPDFKSLMPELLKKNTLMEIKTAEDGDIVKPNHIYFNERSTNIKINENTIRLIEKEDNHKLNLPINIFFKNLADEYKERALGIILSGTGSDGTDGIKHIKEMGGTVIVQEPETAQFDGMPNSAIFTNLVDFILSPKAIAEYLSKINVDMLNTNLLMDSQYHEPNIAVILKEIKKYTGVDFFEYKRNTIIRRIEKRIGLNSLGSIDDYVNFMRGNKDEVEILKRDFLIGVTSFFRDSNYFDILKSTVFDKLVNISDKGSKDIRIWVAACSTGEEAYSIAMMLDDYLTEKNLSIGFKIFATDIDQKAIDLASQGIYSLAAKDDIAEIYFEKYFNRIGDKVQIVKRIRERIVFSKHNLINDPPFIRTDLITCRNLLIYLNNKLQKKVLQTFQFALNKGGFLFLGSSESISNHSNDFDTLDNKAKIYKNKSEGKYLGHTLSNNPERNFKNYSNNNNSLKDTLKVESKPEDFFNNYLANKFSPPSVFIDSSFNIIFIKGDAGKYLFPKEGIFDKSILNMVDSDLSVLIRTTIHKLNTSDKEILVKDAIINHNKDLKFDLYFKKINNYKNHDIIFLIRFSESLLDNDEVNIINNIEIDQISSSRIEALEIELKEAKDNLDKAHIEIDTSNEELQATNEELMTSNEELQSTNEELQSVNEELYTVNYELQEKNKELELLNSDINNIINSTNIGTLLIDTNLNIRKFTPAINKYFNLSEEDIGRPISIFAPMFGEQVKDSLIIDAQKVMKDSITIQKELYDPETKHYYLKKLNPFLSKDKKVKGVVVSFVDITELKRIENIKNENLTKFNIIAESADLGVWEWQIKEDKMVVNENWEVLYGINPNSKTWKTIYENIDENHKEEVKETLEQHLSGKSLIYKMDALYTNPVNKNEYWISSLGKVTERDADGNAIKMVGISQDITTTKNIQIEIEKQRNFTQKLVESSPDSILIFDFESDNISFVNAQFYSSFGYTEKELKLINAASKLSLIHPEDQEKYLQFINNIEDLKNLSTIEYRFKHKDGNWVWCLSFFSSFEFKDGKLVKYIEFILDITNQKLLEFDLIEAKRKAETASIYKNNFLANMSHEIRTPMNGIIGFSELLKEDDLDKETKIKYTSIITENSKQLLRLINDIIDISKIESGEIQMHYSDVNISNLIKTLNTNYQRLLETKNLNGNIKINSILPNDIGDYVVRTDDNRLRQVMINLIDNAIKFTNYGKIEFGFKLNDDFIEFFVQDTGIGIPKKMLHKLFKRFEQLNYNKRNDTGGVGLGLAISKGIVTNLGGKIGVESEIARGSRFYFTIPNNSTSKRSKQIKEPKRNFSNQKWNKILIAEDEKTNQEYLKAILENNFSVIVTADNGLDAVEYYKKESDFDVILMDIRMPKMDGFEATKSILKFDPYAKIIFQSAYAMSFEKEKADESGGKAFITKPINKTDLLETIAKVINK